MRTERNNSHRHWTPCLTAPLRRRSCEDHAKFPGGKGTAYRSWETGWKYTAQGRQSRGIGLTPKHKCWSVLPSGFLGNWSQTKKVNLWPCCGTLCHSLPRESVQWTTVVFADFLLLLFVFILPVREKHREEFQSPETRLFILRVTFDKEINCSS